MSRKIVVYNGSPRGMQSNTNQVINHMLNKLPYDMNLEVSYIDALLYKIRLCRGCSQCFSTGKCPLDKVDEMKKVKHLLLESDLVILGTPVFAGNVSGQFKVMIDRLAYWLHLMCLCGKPIIIVTTSCGNGVFFTDLYLKTIVKFWGGRQIASANYTIFERDDIYSKKADDLSTELATKIVEWFSYKKFEDRTIINDLNKIFYTMQQNIKLYEQDPNFEYRYWNENGLLNLTNFEEVILKYKSITKYLMEVI
ncbi:MAG: flavodoxin family protein [Peptoniphilaceae bacterium]|nr:flavodoxin family protein [Peptoniphilaceae bacterium]MDY6018614.1 flavodoxin family protein [Anaerococcus sp.]